MLNQSRIAVSEQGLGSSKIESFNALPEGYECLMGGEEMGELMRSLDWSNTPFGAVEQWSQSLRSSISICLNSRFPIAIYWGKDNLLLYNDAWRPILGDKHPWGLGRPAREVWSEIWNTVGPEFASVLSTGQGIFHNDELLSMRRFGYTEECYFDYTFNPIQGEKGVVDGVLNIVTETTYRVLNDRRARLLREVASKTGVAKTAEEACELMASMLQADPADIPFSMLYLVENHQARLCAGEAIAQSPQMIDLNTNDDWRIAEVVRTGEPQIIHNLVNRFGVISGALWEEPIQKAMILPIAATGQTKLAAVLVAGISPRLELNENYQDFLAQVAGQISTAIANARSYEEERKRAEQLAELDRAKTLFFSNVSHEFRTPLALMLGPAEDALNAAESGEQRDRLGMIHRNALRLQKLVNTLLDFSRIEAGRIEAVYEPTDLSEFTADLAGMFRSLIERSGLSLRVECAALSEPAYVDREMWEKIVLNLLSNAFKFTFEGEIVVSLSAKDDRIQLQVRDTGTGIPETELAQVFERFHRVKGAQGRSYEGSGIGLSLVQELVKLHGGTIEVSSVIDQGTCFTVSIPTGYEHLPSERVRRSEVDRTQRNLVSTATRATSYVEEASRWLPSAPTVSSEIPVAASIHRSTTRIVLADDNADMRDYLTRLLSPQYEVEAVPDGAAALRAICQHIPDLVLSDVMMPEMDGFELLQVLRDPPEGSDLQTQLNARELPVILLSARAGEEARIEGLAAGADDYLTKPFSARELLARVEATLKLSKLRQEALQREQALRSTSEVAQQEAEAAYRRLGQLLESMGDAFVALDRDWRITYQNAASERINNKPRSEVIGKTIWEEWSAAVGSVSERAYRRAIAEQIPVHFEQHYFEPPDHNVWLEIHAYPFDEGLGIFYRDITARKRAEEALRESEARFRQLTDSAPMLVWMSGIDKLCNYFNQSWLNFTGRTIEEETGHGWAKGVHPDDFDRCLETYTSAFDARITFEMDYRLKRFDGEYRWIYDVGVPRFTPDGEFLGYIGSCFDVHDRKMAEQQKEQLLAREYAAREAAETANRIKDEFLAVLSHELRTPLNPIVGWSKLLKGGNLNAEKTAYAIDIIERNAKLQTQLIEDLLDVSRILRGKLSLTMAPVDVESIVRSALDTVKLAAEAKSIQLHTDFTATPQVLGDAARLQQIVWNLLSNAIKFTPEGGSVTIAIAQIGTQVQITVSDTGQGISAAFLPHVFEYFRQADSASTRKFGGLGLGLAIVRQLVELHGGTVQAESSGENQGATFTVQLPCLKTGANVNCDRPDSKSAPTASLTGIQILVVDDEQDSRDLVAFVLEQSGAIVTAVSSAIEALEAIEQQQFDLLVSDIGMPDMNGYMLMEQIRKRSAILNAIALTAYAGELNQKQAIEAGFQRHLAKPVEPEALVQTVQTLIDRPPV
ncbi:ATP-binding protein [Leptolyngbya sp. AN03gr2]|uniref:ATP-binding protein n=1 Tax=unclassified Leptolyngbya TaxID=2650499 RepID=UPI003D3197A9